MVDPRQRRHRGLSKVLNAAARRLVSRWPRRDHTAGACLRYTPMTRSGQGVCKKQTTLCGHTPEALWSSQGWCTETDYGQAKTVG